MMPGTSSYYQAQNHVYENQLNYLKTRNLAEHYHRKFTHTDTTAHHQQQQQQSYKSDYLNVNITEHHNNTSAVGGSGGGGRGKQKSYVKEDVGEVPVRDSSSITCVKYGPGHEKYPSWPGSVHSGDVVDGPPLRSNSWTEQTNYTKEKVTYYTRPHNKRVNQVFTQQVRMNRVRT